MLPQQGWAVQPLPPPPPAGCRQRGWRWRPHCPTRRRAARAQSCAASAPPRWLARSWRGRRPAKEEGQGGASWRKRQGCRRRGRRRPPPQAADHPIAGSSVRRRSGTALLSAAQHHPGCRAVGTHLVLLVGGIELGDLAFVPSLGGGLQVVGGPFGHFVFLWTLGSIGRLTALCAAAIVVPSINQIINPATWPSLKALGLRCCRWQPAG